MWDSVSQRSQLCTRQREFCCAWKTFIIPLLNTSLYTNLRAEFQEKAWLALPPLLPTGSLCLPHTHRLTSTSGPLICCFPCLEYVSSRASHIWFHFSFWFQTKCHLPRKLFSDSFIWGSETTAYGPNPPNISFWTAFSLVFTFFNGWGKIKRRIFCDTWKLHEIHMSVSVNKALLGYSYTYLFAV